MDENNFDFKAWEERHREILNEVLLPIGMIVILIVTCWAASQ